MKIVMGFIFCDSREMDGEIVTYYSVLLVLRAVVQGHKARR